MRPTGKLHLGHYHGVLKNWVGMQGQYECFYFVADWHALTTHYESPDTLGRYVWEMVIDWLAAGVDPEHATLFVQSRVPEHAELHLLLSMVTPLGWLERVPSFKDQQQRIRDRDLSTYGFLGYPLLQAADILMYRAAHVPVGEDQVPHVELTREIARRFNFHFGRDANFEKDAEQSLERMGKQAAGTFRRLKQALGETGDRSVHDRALELIQDQQSLSTDQKQQLMGYLEGRGKAILPEPEALLTEAARLPGLDGQKMSKSYDNIIAMRDDPGRVEQVVRVMPTDPARVRLSDPGEPDKCPVWPLHRIYSDDETRQWVQTGCRSAAFGCLECKKPLIRSLLREQEEIMQRAGPYERNGNLVREVVEQGIANARKAAQETLEVVRDAVGTRYL